MFPPGFEPLISNEAKIKHAKRRLRKLEKRKKKKSLKHPPSPPSHPPPPYEITSVDVINLAKDLGLKIDGPTSCIENLISAILKRQKADWASANH